MEEFEEIQFQRDLQDMQKQEEFEEIQKNKINIEEIYFKAIENIYGIKKNIKHIKGDQ